MHLAGTYLIAMIVFMAAIEYGQHGEDDSTCAAIGGLLHYFLLASFCWMAIEGQILYQMFVVVFMLTSKVYDDERLRKYALFAYGAPAVVVGIMAAAFESEYVAHLHVFHSNGRRGERGGTSKRIFFW